MLITMDEHGIWKRTLVVAFQLEVRSGQPSPSVEEITTYLNHKLANRNSSWCLTSATVFKRAPIVVANISGGVLQGASSELPTEILTLDYGSNEKPLPVPQNDGSMKGAAVSNVMCDLDPEWIEAVVRVCDAEE